MRGGAFGLASQEEEPTTPKGAGVPDRNQAAAFSPGYRTYVLVVLTLVYVVNYLDRQILGILLPQIQKEFTLTDTDLGFLSGTAFALLYATLGIPVAIFADRMNRRNIVAVSLATFSLMTVLSGYTVQFWQLVLTRFGTGIGEAGTGPSINSVLADLYPPEKRASALAFYSAGLNVGLLLGFFGGGWIAQHYGWRNAFLAAGIPGLVLVFVVMLTVREPVRGTVEGLADDASTPDIWAVVRHLWSQRSFRWLALATSMSAFGGYAVIAFVPKFLLVSHHMTQSEIGLALGFLVGVLGALGTYLGGYFADRWGKRDVRNTMFVPIWASFIAVPFGLAFYLIPSTAAALMAAIVPSLVGAIYLGPSYAMTQALVPLRMRARAVAILLFVLNAIGLGLGPLTVGKISDLLRPAFGVDSLRYALMTGILTSLVAAFCYWRASRTLKADLARGSYRPAEPQS